MAYTQFLSGYLAAATLLASLSLSIRPGFGAVAPAGQDVDTQADPSALPDAPRPQQEDTVTLRELPVRVLKDQAHIWTSPLQIRARDLVWLAPLAAATGAAIATDHHALVSVVSHDSSFNDTNINVSNAMIGGLIAMPVAVYGFGFLRADSHARETGLLGGEAVLDGLVVEQGLKLVFWRERPTVDGAHGRFFQSRAGVDSSFPSSHSVLAWSSAAVLAAEYPSPWAQLGVYSLATGVSVTRVLGQQHFPSDVLVGSAAGWLVGHYVYKAHHRRRSIDP